MCRCGRGCLIGCPFATVGAEPSSSDAASFLSNLNTEIEELARDVKKQGAPADWPAVKWREFLDYKLPTSWVTPGVAPQYKDGPLGWRQYFKLNMDSSTALAVFSDRLIREGKEYQSKLHHFHRIFDLSGKKPTLPTPEKPTVQEMPGPIDPVEISDVAADVVTAAASVPGAIAAPLAEAVTEEAAKGLGVSAKELKIGAVAAIASVAALAAAILLRK
jgi:hypothetical protein